MAANLKFILESISVGGSDNLVLYDPSGKLLAEWECILWEESEGFDAICHRYSFNNWPVGVIQLLQILSCPSCLPPLINIFGQVCPSDCHWSYRARPRPVNWHWTDIGVRRGANWRRWQISDTIFQAANGRHTRSHCFKNKRTLGSHQPYMALFFLWQRCQNQ